MAFDVVSYFDEFNHASVSFWGYQPPFKLVETGEVQSRFYFAFAIGFFDGLEAKPSASV